MNLNNLEQSIKNLEEETSTLKGKVSVLESQFIESTETLAKLKEEQILNAKAVELMNLVQKATKEVICNLFVSIVTRALQFIYQSDEYQFDLVFGKRGNIPELNFNVKTADMKEFHDILDTNAGGTINIVSLALRLVLLEVSQTEGFLFLDEPLAQLDSYETVMKAIEFIKETQKDTNRQMIIITHNDAVVDNVENVIRL